MTESKPYLSWPRADDRIVVEEMLRDHQSGQWYECNEFVKKLVQGQARNIPRDHWEDTAQEAMIRIDKYLPTFRHNCSLKTWLFGIVRSCIIDDHRKFTHINQHIAPGDPHDDVEPEGETVTAHMPATAEDECIIHEELRKALDALREYVSTHANPVRNGRIVNMVLFEGSSLEEAARAVGCSAPVAGYIVRSAQRYVREKLEYQP